MLEHRNSGKNRKEKINFFPNIYLQKKDSIEDKKIQTISCLCTFTLLLSTPPFYSRLVIPFQSFFGLHFCVVPVSLLLYFIHNPSRAGRSYYHCLS
jgi:hypothetical protein